ncbi:MAG: hypothetical protein ACR2P9_09470 [Gammaproteobacteria bacterium]
MCRLGLAIILCSVICLSLPPPATAQPDSAEHQQKQQQTALLLAQYEIEAKRLTSTLDSIDRTYINQHAVNLMQFAESILDWARIRLPQCDAYLQKSLEVKTVLKQISREEMEKNYHHDGNLPKAPPECYHIKDLLIHPASVLLLTRDDPELQQPTRNAINAEIAEVLGHIGAVYQLVIY